MDSFAAFEVSAVVQNSKQSITAASIWENGILIATHGSNSLRYIKCLGTNKDSGAYPESEITPQLQKKSGDFKQIQVVVDVGVFLLVDDVLYLMDIYSGKIVYVFENCKNVLLFSLSSDNSLIAVGTKKSIQIFSIHAKNRQFTIFRDVLLEKALTITFLGHNSMCVGCKEKYMFVNFSDPKVAVKEIFGIGKLATKPISCLLYEEELLLARDSVGISVSYDGKPTRAGPTIDWGELPDACVYMPPYLVSLVPSKGVTVRNLLTSTLCQSVNLKNSAHSSVGKIMSLISEKDNPFFLISNMCLFLVTSSYITSLELRPLMTQVDELVSKKEFSEAISLLSLIDDKGKEKEVKSQYAYALFSRGEYDESMRLFQEVLIDPRQLLSHLYPSMLPTTFQPIVPIPPAPSSFKRKIVSEAELNRSLSSLIPFLQQLRGRLFVTTSAIPEDVFSHYCTFSSLRLGLSEPEVLQSGVKLEDVELLLLLDTVLLKAYLRTDIRYVRDFVCSLNRIAVDEATSLLRMHERYSELVSLYKSRGLHRASLELLLERSVIEKRDDLSGPGALVTYLQDLGSDLNTPPTLIPSHIALILSHSKSILMSDPDLGLSIFTHSHTLPCVENNFTNGSILPPNVVVDHLKKCGDPALCMGYLESLINKGGETDWVFHNELILLYLEALIKLKPVDNSVKYVAGFEPGSFGAIRRKLISFLQSSINYLAERLLTKFPWDYLLEERAILLSRLGQHEAALSIFAHSLNDPQMAEKYCDQFYNADSEEAKDVYLSLIKIYLTKSPEKLHDSDTNVLSVDSDKNDISEERIATAISFLERYFDRIPSSQALALFPQNVPLYHFYNFINSVSCAHSAELRLFQIEKNLMKIEDLQLREENLRAKNARVVIDSDTLCVRCNKRIGMSAFIVFPAAQRTIVHYKCSDEKFVKLFQTTNN